MSVFKDRNGFEVVIAPYSRHSKGAKALRDTLGSRFTIDGATLPIETKIINWGMGSHDGNRPANILNRKQFVSKAVNKISTFTCLKAAGVRTPDWTTSREEAKQWFREGATVMCRTKINGHSGEGIVIPESLLDFPTAPLYTKFIDKDAEYRIHVFDGKVIDARKKTKATDGRPIGDTRICTHDNGYVFNFVSPPDDVKKQAIDAVKALGLDFGAVDVVSKKTAMNNLNGLHYTSEKAYVLEINSAPGLTGATITAYVKAIKEWALTA